MSHTTVLVLVCLATLLSLASSCYQPLPSTYTATADVPAHLQWARLLLDNIPPGSPLTTYKNNNITVWWDTYSCDPSYLSVTDCSGMITAMLERSYNLSVTSGHAYAFTYADATQNETHGFLNIQDMHQVKVGDILSIRYFYDPNNPPKGSFNTGHMGLVNAPPFQVALEPIIEDTIQWAFPLLDQTSTPHAQNDSRTAVGAIGLGTGILRVYTETNGSVVGYTWDLTPNSIFYNQSYNALFVGRLNSTYLDMYPTEPSPTSTPAPITSSGFSSTPVFAFVAVVAMFFAYLL
jgi:hypothetical protein